MSASKLIRGSLALLALTSVVALPASPVKAATIAWTGLVSTAWNTAGNWDLARVPIPSDDVFIPNGGGATYLPTIASDLTLHSLTIEDTLTISAFSPSLTINAINVGDYGGIILGTSSFSSQPSINGPCTLTLDGDYAAIQPYPGRTGTIKTKGPVALVVSGATTTFTVDLNVVNGTTTARTESGASISKVDIDLGASLQVVGGRALDVHGWVYNEGAISGAGALNVTGTSFTTSGTVAIASVTVNSPGTMTLTGGGSFAGSTLMVASGTLDLIMAAQFGAVVVDPGAVFDVIDRSLSLSAAGAPLTCNGTCAVSGSSIRYNGTQPQSLAAIGYYELDIDNDSGVSLVTDVAVADKLIVQNGAHLDVGSNVLTVNGYTSGAMDSLTSAIDGAVLYQGSGSHNILPGSYGNLTIANAFKYCPSAPVTVAGTLTLNSDLTNCNSLALLSSAVASGTADVIGTVFRYGPFAPGQSYGFGNPHVAVTFAAGGTLPTNFQVSLWKTIPAGLTQSIQRTYVVSPVGGSLFTATVRLHYRDAELGGLPEGCLQLWRYDSGTSTWVALPKTASDTSEDWVETAGVAQFSNWAIAVPEHKVSLPLLMR